MKVQFVQWVSQGKKQLEELGYKCDEVEDLEWAEICKIVDALINKYKLNVMFMPSREDGVYFVGIDDRRFTQR